VIFNLRTVLSPEETLALLKAARSHSTRDWAMILLAYRHGLRPSEVCGLNLADIDLKAGSISIPASKVRSTPFSRFTNIAVSLCWTRLPPSGLGCVSGQQTDPDYFFTSQKEENSSASNSFAISRALRNSRVLRWTSSIGTF